MSYISCITNQTNQLMKTTALEITMKVWVLSLGAMTFTAITFAVYKLAVGEYGSTASFMF